MKMKKLTGLLLAGIILSTGATTLASSPDVSAATVISENQYEKVMSFTKADLTAVTGIVLEPTEASIQRMYDSLKKERVWLALGYSSTEAQRITKRMAQSTYQVKNEQTGLKLQDAKAQTYVETLFVGLDAKTSSQEEIKTHIMEQLHANQKGLKKFAFKVKYADKTKVDFKIKYK